MKGGQGSKAYLYPVTHTHLLYIYKHCAQNELCSHENFHNDQNFCEVDTHTESTDPHWHLQESVSARRQCFPLVRLSLVEQHARMHTRTHIHTRSNGVQREEHVKDEILYKGNL